MGKRRKFTDEFKREAVAMAEQPGVTKTQVGRELGVPTPLNFAVYAALKPHINGASALP